MHIDENKYQKILKFAKDMPNFLHKQSVAMYDKDNVIVVKLYDISTSPYPYKRIKYTVDCYAN